MTVTYVSKMKVSRKNQ